MSMSLVQTTFEEGNNVTSINGTDNAFHNTNTTLTFEMIGWMTYVLKHKLFAGILLLNVVTVLYFAIRYSPDIYRVLNACYSRQTETLMTEGSVLQESELIWWQNEIIRWQRSQQQPSSASGESEATNPISGINNNITHNRVQSWL